MNEESESKAAGETGAGAAQEHQVSTLPIQAGDGLAQGKQQKSGLDAAPSGGHASTAAADGGRVEDPGQGPADIVDEETRSGGLKTTPPEMGVERLRELLLKHKVQLDEEIDLTGIPAPLVGSLVAVLSGSTDGTGSGGGDSEGPEGAGRSTASEEELRERQAEHRIRLADQIRESRRLSPGLRDRLIALALEVRLGKDGQEEPALRVSDAVSLLEEALPEQLQLYGSHLEEHAHPGGDSFFTGDATQLSDEEAQRIAKEQLAGTGFAAP